MTLPLRIEIGRWLRDCRNRKRVGKIVGLVGGGHPVVSWNDSVGTTIVQKEDVHENRLSITGYLMMAEAPWLKKR